jgi:hypothetical protein
MLAAGSRTSRRLGAGRNGSLQRRNLGPGRWRGEPQVKSESSLSLCPAEPPIVFEMKPSIVTIETPRLARVQVHSLPLDWRYSLPRWTRPVHPHCRPCRRDLGDGEVGRVEDGRGSLGPVADAPFPIPAHSPAQWGQAFKTQQPEFSIDNVAREPIAPAPCHLCRLARKSRTRS